ncbi:MAG TPA: exo-alpha-sialidase, partial [Undibacterium sp.]|nr:exo-alpha-sialidase [Undibacterium sp.]
ALREGLPQQHCYDLIYRHGLAVSDDGNTLLMASTTGSLWVSENGGDRWQEISSNLPPIYAVRFY